MGNVIPGLTRLGDDDPGNPGNPYNPDGSLFGPYLMTALERGAQARWSTLAIDTTASTADHGKAYSLAGYSLDLDPENVLEAGWYCYVLGPGTLTPDGGDDIDLLANEWVQVGCDGTSIFIMRGGRFPDEWSAVAVVGNQAALDMTVADRFLITVDDDVEIQVPTSARPIAFAVRVLISGGPHAITFASGWLGAEPEILTADGDETILSGIVVDTSPSVTAVINTIKTLAA